MNSRENGPVPSSGRQLWSKLLLLPFSWSLLRKIPNYPLHCVEKYRQPITAFGRNLQDDVHMTCGQQIGKHWGVANQPLGMLSD